jgi:hypothetical protein
VWTFGHAVREIERSHQQVIVEETPTTGAILLFAAFAFLMLISLRNTVGMLLAFFCAAIALYAAVGSSFVADRNRRVLVIKRRVWVWTFERVYEASTIDRVFVRATIKGDGLAVRFKSGRSKELTMSLGFGDNLEDAAAALNQFLYTPHRG